MRADVVPIGNYAIVGDGRSTALLSRGGSLDWLCWPRPDSPSIFGALVDPEAGFWRIAPIADARVTRRYVPRTNVLETIFETATGRVVITDLMPVADEAEKRVAMSPDHEVVRRVECQQGSVEMGIVFHPRPGFGQRIARLDDAGWLGLRMETGDGGLLTLRCEAKLKIAEGVATGRVVLRAGDSIHSSLTWTREGPGVLSPLGAGTRASIARSVAWWRRWSARMTYDGEHRDAVLRSALTLKLLAYAPSGAILAAPTTSLPERIGGALNWDYRFCWLRDASLTVRALSGVGFQEEAEAFVEWLLHSRFNARVRIMYDVYGCPVPRERVLPLSGYRESRPVRAGNGARHQLQLDVYGEAIDAAASLVRGGASVDRATAKMLVGFGDYVARNWQTPDQGIWEPREEPQLHTHSLLLCWTALDRLLDLDAKKHLRLPGRSGYSDARDRIAATIRHFAWSDSQHAYTGAIGGDDLDAATLLIPWYGFEPASSGRMQSTWREIQKRLGDGPLLHRYRDDRSDREGAFGICSFWGAEFLALGGGSERAAHDRFEALLRYANDVGLYAEEVDSRTGEALGNFPQAFTHVGLVNAALSLERRARGHLERPAGRMPHASPREATT